MPYRKGRVCTLSVGGVEVVRAVDVNPTRSSDEIDTTTRFDSVFKTKDVSLNEWGLSFTMKLFISDSAIATILAAWAAQTEVEVALTGGAGGTEGGNGYITRADESQPIDDVVTLDVDIVGNGALS